MDKQTIALLRTSFAEIVRRRPDVAAVFYKRLFEVAPDLRPMFSPSLKEQQKKLKASLTQIVTSLGDSGQLPEQLVWLGERHVDDELKPAHYRTVGDTLLWTFQHALQQSFTKPIRAAWAEAYNIIAKKMIAAAREKVERRPSPRRAAAKPVVRRVKRTAATNAAESGKRKAARRPIRKSARRTKRAS